MQRIISRAFPSTSSAVSTVNTPYMVDRRPPPDLGKWANFRRFIWNREKRMLCNRTCSSWCKIITFYMIFIILLLGLFFLVMIGATEHIRDHYKLPWIEKKDLIPGSNPGVAFLPNIIKLNSPLVWYTFQGSQSLTNMKYPIYVKYINKFLERYDEAEKNTDDYIDCSQHPNSTKSCIFLRKSLGPCGENTFGYENKQPCIYIKLNKLPDWAPEYYTGHDLPHEMPESLKQVIKADSDKKKVYVHCDGVIPADLEHMGSVSYYPSQGFMGYYFPFTGASTYLTPLVAVKINNIKKGYVVDIRCSAWAKNIHYGTYKTHSTDIHMYLALN